MLEVKVYSVISSVSESVYLCAGNSREEIFSAQAISDILSANPDEKDIRFNIHCPGGSVNEGLAIYDILRTSGRNIYMNIDGSCHSMSLTLLLAAPYENRSANRNCRALMHQVYGGCMDMNAGQIEAYAKEIKADQEAILNIYAERTTTDRETLESIMKEERILTSDELLELGFVSKINNYNTNYYQQKKNSTMSKKIDFVGAAKNFAQAINNLLNGEVKTNFDFTDADGGILFSTEKEDDSIEVGDPATPDGTFELPDGRTVTVADGVVAEIKEPDMETETLRAENASLHSEVENLRNMLEGARTHIVNLSKEITSNYEPKIRQVNPKANMGSVSVKEQIKNKLNKK